MSEESDARKASFTVSKKPKLTFDFVLDLLIRNKSNHEMFEDFLSEALKYLKFLSSDGKIVIDEVKDEYPERDPGLRKGVDVFARDDKGEHFIIKVCCYYNSDSFLDKSVHNVSKTIMNITDGLKRGVDVIYKTRKTFYFNILYKSHVYRIKPMNCVSIGTKIDKDSKYYRKDALEDRCQLKKRSEVEEIEVFDNAPEFVVINLEVLDEDDVKDRVSEWLYLIKNAGIKDTFESIQVKKAANILDRLSKRPEVWDDFYDWLSEDLKAVEYYLANIGKGYHMKDRGRIVKELVKRMIAQGSSIESIAVTTGCSLEEVESLNM